MQPVPSKSEDRTAESSPDRPSQSQTEPDEPDIPDRLKYLRNVELRREIAYAAGGDPTRYTGDKHVALNKADLVRVADSLQPVDSVVAMGAMDLAQLYNYICRWASGEYSPNSGNPWGINRDNLKLIHTALGAGPVTTSE